jgi:regulator of sigma E protease
MAWVIAIAGFMFLIVAHEAGHFLAAKAVGMRVERFSLFFPPRVAGFRVGETDYQIGALPFGGYVKITGMTPEELASVDLRVSDRAYYMKSPWRRIVVILAGPAVNLLLAIVLMAAVLLSGSLEGSTAIGNLAPSQRTLAVVQQTTVAAVERHSGAAGVLRAGDRIVAIDGRPVGAATVAGAIDALHLRCSGTQTGGCAATQTVAVTVVRGGRTTTLRVQPHYDASLRRMLLGINLGRIVPVSFSLTGAIGTSVAALWDVGSSTVTYYVKAVTSSKVRKQLQSVVGITQDTQQAVTRGAGFFGVLLALVSLVLAVVNLFPFLPLDGGHIVWSLAEKVRGRRVSVGAMWRYSMPGVLLLAFLVLNGLGNDVSRLAG